MVLQTRPTELPVDALSDLGVTAQSNPELAVLAGAVVALIVIFSWLLLRWVRRPPAAKLKRALERYDAVTVLMHPNPDPDAMACAIGIARIAEWVGTDVHIQYSGQIRHQENRAFRTVLDLEMEQIESNDELANEAVVLVDHNTPRGFVGADRVSPVIVVDHHIGDGMGTAFTDVRPAHGSCASIVTEYFRDLDAVRLGPDDRIPEEGNGLYLCSSIATGLLFGIQSDTNHLTNGCHDAEFDAASYLFPIVDNDRLDRIANPSVTSEVLDTKAAAITNRTVDGSFAVSYVGELSDADAVPQAADELVTLEGITAVVVMGQRNDTLHLSGRSRDDRVHMGRALEEAVKDIPLASAGGHARMGGGQVSVEHMKGLGPSNGVSVDDLSRRIFDCMNGDV